MSFGSIANADSLFQDSSFELGGGYLDETERGYFFGQLRGTVYETADFRNTLFLEFLFYDEDVDVELFFADGGSGLFDGSIDYFNLSVGYEGAWKLSDYVELYAGGAAGAQFVSLNLDGSGFGNRNLDDDTRFVAQAFAGLRLNMTPNTSLRLGARRIFTEDFEVLGDQLSGEDQWGYEAALTFKF